MCGNTENQQTATVTDTNGPTDPIARLRWAMELGLDRGEGPLEAILKSEQKYIAPILDEIDDMLIQRRLATLKAQEAKSAIQDSLLEAVLENQQLERNLAQMRQNALEAERTIVALTKVSPHTLRAAAFTVDQYRGEMEDDAKENPLLDALGNTGGAFAEMREGARQLRELAIAVERADEGVKAP